MSLLSAVSLIATPTPDVAPPFCLVSVSCVPWLLRLVLSALTSPPPPRAEFSLACRYERRPSLDAACVYSPSASWDLFDRSVDVLGGCTAEGAACHIVFVQTAVLLFGLHSV